MLAKNRKQKTGLTWSNLVSLLCMGMLLLDPPPFYIGLVDGVMCWLCLGQVTDADLRVAAASVVALDAVAATGSAAVSPAPAVR